MVRSSLSGTAKATTIKRGELNIYLDVDCNVSDFPVDGHLC